MFSYIWLGCKSSNDVRRAVKAFATDSPVISPYRGIQAPDQAPASSYSSQSSDDDVADFQLGRAASVKEAPEKFTAFHYVKGRAARLPYREAAVHKEFRTFIYSFVWEDPSVDMQHLGITEADTCLCITSAGDNALHYAISARPKTIHCVEWVVSLKMPETRSRTNTIREQHEPVSGTSTGTQTGSGGFS